ncbi:MAG: hypothetical protein P1P84_14990 [Deferrisomatales bacterium]|nr:hypothetical protein [Deferrisomatales bacterium]
MKISGNLGRRLGVWTLLGALLAGPALGLDAQTVRDIERTDSAEKLARLADKIASDAATRQPKEFEEGTQIATETNSYLLYIIVKQNALLLKAQEQN